MSGPLEFLIVFAILGGLVVFLSAPLRSLGSPAEAPCADEQLLELEAARETKLRELRDAELDHRTGKLSDEDYAELDASLRGEAIEILRQLDHSKAPPLGDAEQTSQPLPSPRS